MSREVLVVLPHSLGREEARRRVTNAIERAQATLGQGLVNTDVQWPREDHGALSVRAMGQTVVAEIDIEDAQVRVRVLLPWLLARFAGKITERIEQAGTTLQIGHDPKAGAPPKT
ncbi:MAG: polyhydroxyalkanoic acid system family protein [Beijerinckiaceae bacterium]|nr:polyhydroxyalkanoic acid system family protein [Beijerinckiaceae bacterium]